MTDPTVSLVERLLRIADWIGEQSRGHREEMSVVCSKMSADVREAASRLASVEPVLHESCGKFGCARLAEGTRAKERCIGCGHKPHRHHRCDVASGVDNYGNDAMCACAEDSLSTPPDLPAATRGPFSKTWSDNTQQLESDASVSAASRPAQTQRPTRDELLGELMDRGLRHELLRQEADRQGKPLCMVRSPNGEWQLGYGEAAADLDWLGHGSTPDKAIQNALETDTILRGLSGGYSLGQDMSKGDGISPPTTREDYIAKVRESTAKITERVGAAEVGEASPAATSGPAVTVFDYPNPTEADQADPVFEAIWQAIKRWDVSRGGGALYSGATGSDVMHILQAVRVSAAERPAPTCATCLRVHEIASRMAERPTLMGCDDINDLVMIVALTEPSLSLPAAPRSVVAPEKG